MMEYLEDNKRFKQLKAYVESIYPNKVCLEGNEFYDTHNRSWYYCINYFGSHDIFIYTSCNYDWTSPLTYAELFDYEDGVIQHYMEDSKKEDSGTKLNYQDFINQYLL